MHRCPMCDNPNHTHNHCMPPKLKDKKVDHFFASIKKRRFIGSGEDVPFDHELKDLMERNDYSIY